MHSDVAQHNGSNSWTRTTQQYLRTQEQSRPVGSSELDNSNLAGREGCDATQLHWRRLFVTTPGGSTRSQRGPSCIHISNFEAGFGVHLIIWKLRDKPVVGRLKVTSKPSA